MARGPGGSTGCVGAQTRSADSLHPRPPRTCSQTEGSGAGWWVPQGGGTHLTHPVHSGADQVEGADADGPHAIGRQGLTVSAWLLRLGGGRAGCCALCSAGHQSWALALRTRPEQKHDRPCPAPKEGTVPCHWQNTRSPLKLPKKARSLGRAPVSRLEKPEHFLRATEHVLTGGAPSLWMPSLPEKMPFPPRTQTSPAASSASGFSQTQGDSAPEPSSLEPFRQKRTLFSKC